MTSDALREVLTQMREELPEEVQPVIDAVLAGDVELEAVWNSLLDEALSDET